MNMERMIDVILGQKSDSMRTPPVSAALSKTALLLIDFQKGLFLSQKLGCGWSNQTVRTAASLLHATRQWNDRHRAYGGYPSRTVDILHVRQHSTDWDSPLRPTWVTMYEDEDSRRIHHGIDPLPLLKEIDGETIFVRNANSAFIGTALEMELFIADIRQLIICGLTTDHSVSSTVRTAFDLKVVNSSDGKEKGKIILVQDACATLQRDGFSGQVVHNVHVASLRETFAYVMDAKDVQLHLFDTLVVQPQFSTSELSMKDEDSHNFL